MPRRSNNSPPVGARLTGEWENRERSAGNADTKAKGIFRDGNVHESEARRIFRGFPIRPWDGLLRASVVLAASLVFALPAAAEPWAAPGDMVLRADLLLLDDTGVIDIPLATWPLPWGDIDRALANVNRSGLSAAQLAAFERLKSRVHWESDSGELRYKLAAGAGTHPRLVRTFEDTPREQGKLSAGVSWLGNHLALNLQASVVANPLDDDEIRPDGSYVGLALGNWMFSAGWQDRWWGPGWGGSLILSSNARATPGFAIQRNNSTPFESKWLRWIGPWSVTTFLSQLDDERFVNDALLFGLRLDFKPLDSLEIGFSRTAQWCGDARPCDFSAFGNLLVGNDNQGVNVDPNDEPGNQLAGIDIRWTLPKKIPVALYMQWIGEDTRRGGPEIGSWLRQFGVEHWGHIGALQHRTYVEITDTECREGGFGYGDPKPDCGYGHSIYRTGYRYRGRSLGHGMDGDGLSYSLGSTLVQSAGHSWNLTLRYMEINRSGAPDTRHTLSATPEDLMDIQLTHSHLTDLGRVYLGLGYRRFDPQLSGVASSNDVTAFIQWTTE